MPTLYKNTGYMPVFLFALQICYDGDGQLLQRMNQITVFQDQIVWITDTSVSLMIT